MKETVVAVVVTYNRKALLVDCLSSLVAQSKILDKILIIDNCSTDGTSDYLIEYGYVERFEHENFDNTIKHRICSTFDNSTLIEIQYLKKEVNDGGAGGFHDGIKLAFEQGFDWIWIMDDDGVPDINCLKNLSKYAIKSTIDYVAPNLIDKTSKSHFELYFNESENNIINYFGGPFNGILISDFLVKQVGLPIKHFFIWGDEMEYVNRITEKGLVTITVKNAIHYHKSTGFNYRKVPRVFYLTRNLIYQSRLYKGIYRSKKVKSLGVISIIVKILFYGVLGGNLKQIMACFEGLYHGFKTDIRELQKNSIEF